MNRFVHWIHHLFNPHCQDCVNEELENKVCESCETLKVQLSIANNEKQQLLNSILELTKPQSESVMQQQVDFKQLKPTMMTWNVRKRMLEAEDRAAAKLMAENKKREEQIKSIEKLEEELGLDTEVQADA